MTVTTDRALPSTPTAPAPFRLVKAELLKVWTTNMWWILVLITLALTAMTFGFNALQADFVLGDMADLPTEQLSEADLEVILATADVTYQASNLYTSGQFLGLIFVMVIGIMLMTSEFHHQTATATFLTTPHRTAVVLAKLVASIPLATIFWLVSFIFNLLVTPLLLSSYGFDSQLGNSAVLEAIGLNLLAYLLWAILGVGLGVLLRSQIAAIITGILLYVAGYVGVAILFTVLAQQFDADWLMEWQVIVPSIASQLMVTGIELPGSPPQWVGAVVLVAWAFAAGLIGVLITRKRDIG